MRGQEGEGRRTPTAVDEGQVRIRVEMQVKCRLELQISP